MRGEMVDWGLVDNGIVNWAAAQTISNAILVLVLIVITAYYARQTARQVKLMEISLRYQMAGSSEMLKFSETTEEFMKQKARAKRWWQFWRRD